MQFWDQNCRHEAHSGRRVITAAALCLVSEMLYTTKITEDLEEILLLWVISIDVSSINISNKKSLITLDTCRQSIGCQSWCRVASEFKWV